jgi:predicted Zn-dependent protease
MKRHRHFLPRFFLFFLPILLLGCAEVVQVGTTIGAGMGKISPEDKERLDRMAATTAKAVRPMTEREEYYVGRAVAATILSQYRLYTYQPSTRYLNEVGQAVALASDRPLTYGGYHFAILDSQEVNAIACPGGIIFVTRGALRRASNEEELAAILAHEVAHVNHKDGLASIQRARWVEAVSLMGAEAAQQLGGTNLAKLVSLFQGSVNDVVKTILVSGYSREQEMAADSAALLILPRLRYDPHGLTDFLERIAREQKGGSPNGIFSTHPGVPERLAAARATIAEKKWTRLDHRVRDQRFRQNIRP